MKEPKKFNRAITISMLAVMAMYVPTAIVGYYVYGSASRKPPQKKRGPAINVHLYLFKRIAHPRQSPRGRARPPGRDIYHTARDSRVPDAHDGSRARPGAVHPQVHQAAARQAGLPVALGRGLDRVVHPRDGTHVDRRDHNHHCRLAGQPVWPLFRPRRLLWQHGPYFRMFLFIFSFLISIA